jgi:hypothetical protein
MNIFLIKFEYSFISSLPGKKCDSEKPESFLKTINVYSDVVMKEMDAAMAAP